MKTQTVATPCHSPIFPVWLPAATPLRKPWKRRPNSCNLLRRTGPTPTVRPASKLHAPSTNCVMTPNLLKTQKTPWSHSSNILPTPTPPNNCVDPKFYCFPDHSHLGDASCLP